MPLSQHLSPELTGSPRPDWYPAAAAFALAFALYACTLWGTWVLDDILFVGADPRVFSVSQWPLFLTQGYIKDVPDNLWRPLTSLSFALQHQISGLTLWPLHLVNVLAHATAAALVAELARRLVGLRAAWIAGLLFAAHPVHVDAVAYLVGRAELLCAIGALAALVLFLHRPLTIRRSWAIFACFLFAAFSKEQGILLPLILLALAGLRGWHRQDAPLSPRQRTAARWLVVLLTWGLAAYLIYRESILPFCWSRELLDWTINPLVRAEGLDRVLIPIAALGRYLQLLVAPWQLSLDYGAKVFTPTQPLHDPYLYLGLLTALGGTVALVLALVRRNGASAFCLIALALTYGMVSNLPVLIGTVFGERLMYLPSAFFLLLVAQWAAGLPRRWLVSLLLVLLVLSGLRTVTYAVRWNNRLEFLQYSLRHQPRSLLLQFALIEEELRRGHLEAAEAIAAEARRSSPEHIRVWLQSAAVAECRGERALAEQYRAKAREQEAFEARTYFPPLPIPLILEPRSVDPAAARPPYGTTCLLRTLGQRPAELAPS